MPLTDAKIRDASAFLDTGQPARAKQLFMALFAKLPSDPAVLAGLGLACARVNELPQARFYAQRLASLKSTDPAAIQACAQVFIEAGDGDAASKELLRGLALFPTNPGLCETYATLLYYTHKVGEGLTFCDEARGRGVESDGLTMTHASLLRSDGRVREAVDALRRVTRALPDFGPAWEQLAMTIQYDGRANAGEVFDAHQRAGQLMQRQFELLPPRAPRTQRERWGFLSPDFATHSVAFFAEALIEHLVKQGEHVELFSTNPKEDEHTARFRAFAAHYHECWSMSAAQVASLVREREIDFYVDLAGYSMGGVLGAFAMRPAPVQVNYLGYAHSTGLPSMDVRVVDSITDPPGDERFASERLVRIDPCFLCYRPPKDLSPKRTAATAQCVTFASFNVLTKMDDGVVDAWARVLQSVPGSTLLLKGSMLKEERVRDRVRAQFAAHSISADRLELVAWVDSQRAHLDLYQRVDIALDPFPYNGTTTTCEALSMGVPVVTLRGDRHGSRVGASLLTCVGAPELIAESVDQYVSVARELAMDQPRRQRLHDALPAMLERSALRDEAVFAKRFADAVKGKGG